MLCFLKLACLFVWFFRMGNRCLLVLWYMPDFEKGIHLLRNLKSI